MDVLCSLVQQDIAEVEKEDREMAERSQDKTILPPVPPHHGGHTMRSEAFMQPDRSLYTHQQLPSFPSHISERNDDEMSDCAPPPHQQANQIQHTGFQPQFPPINNAFVGNSLSRQYSSQPSWQHAPGGAFAQANLRRVSSAPNSGPNRAPLYPAVPSSRNLEFEKRSECPGEKIRSSPKRSIKKSPVGPQKAKKRRSSLQLPGDVYCRLCGTKETPEWRRGPDGLKSLCNACGIHFARMMRAERKVVAAKEEETRRKASIINIMNH